NRDEEQRHEDQVGVVVQPNPRHQRAHAQDRNLLHGSHLPFYWGRALARPPEQWVMDRRAFQCRPELQRHHADHDSSPHAITSAFPSAATRPMLSELIAPLATSIASSW